MKDFIKDLLIILVLSIVVTSLFSGISSSSKEKLEDSVTNEVYVLEGTIASNNVVQDGVIEEKEHTETGNFFSKIGKTISSAIVFIIRKIVNLIASIIYKIMQARLV